MQYSPKLKIAMEKIKAVLKEHDISGVVVLHTPGHAEYTVQITPSYSCAKYDEINPTLAAIKVRAKLKEDFNGNKDAWTKKVSDTADMFDSLSMITGKIGLDLMKVMDGLKHFIDIERTGRGHTGHDQQNN